MPLLGFLVCSFMMAAYSFDADVGAGRSEYTGAIVASAVVVALCAMRLKSPFVMLIDRLAVPACVAVSIVLGSFPTGTTLFVAGRCSYTRLSPAIALRALIAGRHGRGGNSLCPSCSRRPSCSTVRHRFWA
ncbi:MAG: hypothetical protein ACLT98_17580 [Eggerthellaceae bacterium]